MQPPNPRVRRHIVARTKRYMRWGLHLDLWVHKAFFRHGMRVSRHPWRWIAGTLLLLCMPLLMLPEFTTYPGVAPLLFDANMGSFDALRNFGAQGNLDVVLATEATLASSTAPLVGNVLTEAALDALWHATAIVQDQRHLYEGQSLGLQQVCQSDVSTLRTHKADPISRASDVTECNRMSVLDVWPSREAYAKDAAKVDTVAAAVVQSGSGRRLRLASGKVLPLELLGTGWGFNDTGKLTEVRMFRMRWELAGVPETPELNTRTLAVRSLMQKINLAMQELSEKTASVALLITSTPRPLATDSLFTDFFIFVGLVFAYTITVGVSISKRGGNAGVLFLGSFNALLSAIATAGLFGMVGISGAPTTLYGAGVVLAIGVDDVFLLVSTVSRVRDDNPRRRLARGVAESATSILMTTVTDLVVFGFPILAGGSPSVKNLCLFITIGLSVDFVAQLGLVVGALAIDVQRQSSNQRSSRRCLGLVSKASDKAAVTNDEDLQSSVQRNDTGVDNSSPRTNDVSTVTEDTTSRYIVVAKEKDAFSVADSDIEAIEVDDRLLWRDDSSALARMLSSKWALWTFHPSFKAMALLLFLSVLGLAVYCVVAGPLQVALLQDIGNDDAVEYIRARKIMYASMEVADEQYMLVERGTAYWKSDVQKRLARVCDQIAGLNSSLAHPLWAHGRSCWWQNFTTWSNGTIETSSEAFVAQLKRFLAEDAQAAFRQHILFSEGGQHVHMTRFTWFAPAYRDLEDSLTQAAQMLASLPQEPEARFAGVRIHMALSAKLTEAALVETGVVTSVIVAVVAGLFLVNPFTGVIVSVAMGMTALSVFGLLRLLPMWNVDSTMLFMAILTMGFGVDFTSHIIHAFNTTGGGLVIRTQTAFAVVGSSIVHGCFSAVVAMICTAMLSTSESVAATFAVFCASLVISLVLAITVTPVILHYVQPPPALRDMEMHLYRKAQLQSLEWRLHREMVAEKERVLA